MTIQEAIKSGKPFKRRGEPLTYTYSPAVLKTVSATIVDSEGKRLSRLRLADILATDWEVKENV